MERTLLLIKPDAFHRTMVGRIITKLEEKGLQMIGAKLIMLDDDILNKLYEHLSSTPFFDEVKTFMRKGPVLVTCWEGVDCVKIVRLLCGITNAREADLGTIRGDWAISTMCNLVHSPESREHAKEEISLYFSEEELVSYKRQDIPILYSKRESQDHNKGDDI